MGFLDGFLSKESQEGLAAFSKKAKKELSKLPVISAVGDAVQGASGLNELQENLNKYPNDPKSWLYYYEGHMMYRKINGGTNIGRVVINPVGFAVAKGVSTGLNTLDDEYEKFNPKKCLGMTIALVMKKIKKEQKKIKAADLVLLAKALGYSSAFAQPQSKDKLLKRAVHYITLAIEVEETDSRKAEYFFYLAQFYKQANDEKNQLRALNISRKLGFQPADELLKRLLKKRTEDVDIKSNLANHVSPTPYQTYQFTYYPQLGDRVGNSWEHMKKQQTEKFTDTKNRLSKFL